MDNIEKGEGTMKMRIKIVEKWRERDKYYVKVRDEKTGIEAIGKSSFDYERAFDQAVEKLERLVWKYGRYVL